MACMPFAVYDGILFNGNDAHDKDTVSSNHNG